MPMNKKATFRVAINHVNYQIPEKSHTHTWFLKMLKIISNQALISLVKTSAADLQNDVLYLGRRLNRKHSAPGRFWAENSITAGGVVEPLNQRDTHWGCDIFVPVIAVHMEKLLAHILKEGIKFCFSGSIGDRLEEKLLLQGKRMLGGVFPEATYTLHAQKIMEGGGDRRGPFGRAQELRTIWVG